LARIRDISEAGLCLETQLRCGAGDPTEIRLSQGVLVRGRVVWCGGGRLGVEFETPLEPRLLHDGTALGWSRSQQEQYHAPVFDKPALLDCGSDLVFTLVREISPWHVMLDQQPSLHPGLAVRIWLPTGAERRGVIREARGGSLTLLVCRPFKLAEIADERRIED
jgi:hypothetical protein